MAAGVSPVISKTTSTARRHDGDGVPDTCSNHIRRDGNRLGPHPPQAPVPKWAPQPSYCMATTDDGHHNNDMKGLDAYSCIWREHLNRTTRSDTSLAHRKTITVMFKRELPATQSAHRGMSQQEIFSRCSRIIQLRRHGLFKTRPYHHLGDRPRRTTTQDEQARQPKQSLRRP